MEIEDMLKSKKVSRRGKNLIAKKLFCKELFLRTLSFSRGRYIKVNDKQVLVRFSSPTLRTYLYGSPGIAGWKQKRVKTWSFTLRPEEFKEADFVACLLLSFKGEDTWVIVPKKELFSPSIFITEKDITPWEAYVENWNFVD